MPGFWACSPSLAYFSLGSNCSQPGSSTAPFFPLKAISQSQPFFSVCLSGGCVPPAGNYSLGQPFFLEQFPSFSWSPISQMVASTLSTFYWHVISFLPFCFLSQITHSIFPMSFCFATTWEPYTNN